MENNYSDSEIIQLSSGQKRIISQHDIHYLSQETKDFVKPQAFQGKKIALYCTLDNMQLTPLVLYHVFTQCNATVIRCGISDFNRQLPIVCNIELDYVVASLPVYEYLKDKVHYRHLICISSIEFMSRKWPEKAYMVFYELDMIPGFVAAFGLAHYSIPGYTIATGADNSFTVTSHPFLDSINVSNICIGKSLIQKAGKTEPARNIVKDFIYMAVQDVIEKTIGIVITKDEIELNSFNIIELCIGLEEHFDIEIDVEKTDISSINCLSSITELVYSLLMGGELCNIEK